MKRSRPAIHLVAIDGTWQDPTTVQTSTALRLMEAIGPMDTAAGDSLQYVPGLGYDPARRNPLGRLLAGAVGHGLHARVSELTSRLVARTAPRDAVVLVGCSRGAAIARMMAARLVDRGRRVRLVVAVDTVSALGLPWVPWLDRWMVPERLPPAVESAVHLLALDEGGRHLRPRRLRETERHLEIWLPGDHGDLCGTRPGPLADLALRHVAALVRAAAPLLITRLPPWPTLRQVDDALAGRAHLRSSRPLGREARPTRIAMPSAMASPHPALDEDLEWRAARRRDLAGLVAPPAPHAGAAAA
ncbi:MAG: DUF2235 domain-containing protein [Acidobacteriota bacterium]